MATLLNRNGTYYLDIHDAEREPPRKRLSLRTEDKSTAQELLGKLTRAYRLGEWDPWTETVGDFNDRPNAPLSLTEAIERFLEAKNRDLARLTVKDYRSQLTRFAERVGTPKTVEGIRREEIEKFSREETVASSTQRKRHSLLKSFFSWLRQRKFTEANPMREVPLPSAPKDLPNACLPRHLRHIANALIGEYITQRNSSAPPPPGGMVWHVDLWYFLLWTGLRIREAARLRWKDVKPSEGLIILREQKSGEAGTSLLTEKAKRVLQSYRKARAPVDPQEYVFSAPHTRSEQRNTDSWCIHRGQTFLRYRRRALPEEDFSQHSLRHGFCTLLAKRGCSAYTIKTAARHSAIKTSQRYVDLILSDVRDEVDSVL